MPTGPLASLLLAKIREQVDGALRLLELLPPESLGWRPETAGGRPPMAVDELLGHLLECLAGFCAVHYALHPHRLAHFQRLREAPVNRACDLDEARARVPEYLRRIEEGFGLMGDDDLGRTIPTVFVPEGEAAFTILLGNLEHLTNHKYQLFFYLRLLGVDVGTPDLYQLKGRE